MSKRTAARWQRAAERQVRAGHFVQPLSCPLPSMALWNSHPRVYLPIEANRTDGGRGEADCPYCGAHFILVD